MPKGPSQQGVRLAEKITARTTGRERHGLAAYLTSQGPVYADADNAAGGGGKLPSSSGAASGGVGADGWWSLDGRALF